MRNTNAGFTIIELMVGMAIALLGSLAIMQAFTGRESDRRAIGSVSDSQTNALLGMFMIERDLQQAGMGFSDLRSLGCTVVSTTNNLNGLPLMSVGIVPADGSVNPWNLPLGDAGSDMLIIAYGTSENTSDGKSTRSVVAGTATIPLNGVQGFNLNDAVLLAENGRPCTLGRITGTNPASREVILDSATASAYSSNGRALNLGGQPRMLAYAVRNASLTVCNFAQSNCTGGADDTSIWVPILNDIVALRAQYGVDTSVPADGRVDAYCQSVLNGNCAPGTAPAPVTACDFSRIGATYIGLVSRSGQAEKTEVSPATIKIWDDSALAPTTTGPIWTVPDRHYRYRTVATTVALRNTQLLGAQSGC